MSITYDVYLEILDKVQLRVNKVLGRTQENWRLLNSCPPCTYRLEGEPELEFELLCEMDGNNSLKRTGAAMRHVAERPDSCLPSGDYMLPREYVDQFKDEVPPRSVSHKVDICMFINCNAPLQSKQKGKGAEVNDNIEPTDDWADIDENDPLHICINRWHNTGPEQRKRMFKMFDESGIFLCACRHGVILLMCDMVQSGEL